MSVDNQEVFHVQDPQPLPGGHIAIWTRDNGIMVARVRVSAEEVTDRESADVPAPALCRSVYDPPLPAR
jgi:hypothetical protein